jgi:hypothetical protein
MIEQISNLKTQSTGYKHLTALNWFLFAIVLLFWLIIMWLIK